MPSPTSLIKTCFISAPLGADLGVLRAALEARGVRVLVPKELAVGADWVSEIRNEISHADLVIGIVPSARQAPWVLFELGQASALDRRIVLITSPKAEPVPFSLHQVVTLRIDLDNTEAIEFALDQVMSAPPLGRDRRPASSQTFALGGKADTLIAKLRRSLADANFAEVEAVVAEALRDSGTDAIASSTGHDVGADFAVWSDVLEPFVGNPLLIEVKAKLTSKTAASKAFRQLATYMDKSGSRWALLLYGEGPRDEKELSSSLPNVLVLSVQSLLENLRTQSFPELVRDLRNRRVHGATS
jgi:hypothetical protein